MSDTEYTSGFDKIETAEDLKELLHFLCQELYKLRHRNGSTYKFPDACPNKKFCNWETRTYFKPPATVYQCIVCGEIQRPDDD